MPDIHQLGATSSTGVNLIDSTRYRIFNYAKKVQRTRVLVPLAGGNNVVLSREEINFHDWDFTVFCVRSGYQNKLDDFNAIITQINNAISFSLGTSGTAIYLWEQFGTQTTVLQYLVITGSFDEEERAGGGANLRKVGKLSLTTRIAGV